MSADGPDRARSLSWLELALAAALGGGAFALLGMEIVWVIAGVVAGWVLCRVYQRRDRGAAPSSALRRHGQILVGGALGPALATQHFDGELGYIPVLVGALIAVLVGSVLVAYAYSRWAGIDQLTSGLATLPGGLVILPAVAADLDRSPQLVAVVQAARMVVVVGVVAAVAPALGDVARLPLSSVAEIPGSVPGWGYWAVLLAGSYGAAHLASRWRVPVAALLGPMFFAFAAVLALRALGVHTDLLGVPHAQEMLGQLLLGVTVGEYLAQRTRLPLSVVTRGFVSVAATFLLAVGIAAVLTAVTPWSFLTCLLIVAPGGAPEMVVIAAAVDADLHVVVLAQILRQLAINGALPLWIALFRRLG
ncbi:AbrB family transcriptional regulator [Spiractinospora alimapuensis]|uniref:AbrB family transcriptional regulator n=1 Tax=Spiractinospora alimapuensis TaxID=2820884 RepID=UPI001F41E3C4|nr:AbrB family transcriptional regulator [Spiractinospora alimapuensis]QVQ52369.1 AbrB family transcriptional regulator [Spiractinospora alimapuensis]